MLALPVYDMSDITLRQWLQNELATILNRQGNILPLIVWCDPDRVWRDLLLAASESGTFELWADETHELILRERFAQTARAPRVVWLPVQREEIGYFEVFALQAAHIWEESLPQALSRYGVKIPHDRWHELAPLLPAYAKTWLDYPLAYWRKNFPTGSLLNDDAILQILAGVERPLSHFVEESLMPVFYRRVTEDFGLPNAQAIDLETWRVRATAVLLVTDAAQQLPSQPPNDAALIIQEHVPRQQSLKLLAQWQQRLDLLDAFETLAAQADGLTGLSDWASQLDRLPPPLASPAAEQALFAAEIRQLSALAETPEALTQRLDRQQTNYAAHAHAFWGKTAVRPIRWDWLVNLANWAQLLHKQKGLEKGWRSPAEAITWYTSDGWQVDYAGETLFREETEMPSPLLAVRAALRLAYQRHLDRTNQVFSELLAHHSLPPLPYTGAAITSEVRKGSKSRPIAIFVVDACRYDVGQRLAALLNAGEPQERATISTARAPLPAITAIGMPLLLPGISDLEVTWTGKSLPWQVSAPDFEGNLASKSDRIKWLKQTYKLSDGSFRQIGEVLDGAERVSVKENGRLLFVFADELDDHDGNLKPHGLDREIERYAALLRQLRTGGYSTILVVTDHGFFHWEGDRDERAVAKPDGELLYTSRRAIVGHDLHHANALILPVSGNDRLQCATPRSIQAFKTRGGLDFFHGGATLQELIIPVLTIRWPQQMREIGVVLKPINQITSLSPRVEIEPEGVDPNLLGELDEKLVGRRVQVTISHSQTGQKLFTSAPVTVEPGGKSHMVQLARAENAQAALRSKLDIVVHDADSDEILDRCMATLLKELDEWF